MPAGFPHSEISGSKVACTSPKLIAACHVLLRLHAPRHPPCALSSLTIKFAQDKINSISIILLSCTHAANLRSFLQMILFPQVEKLNLLSKIILKMIYSRLPIQLSKILSIAEQFIVIVKYRYTNSTFVYNQLQS